MILLDTQVWMWWAAQSRELNPTAISRLNDLAAEGLGVSRISCWEVAKKVERG